MRMLVTGANGFTGLYLREALERRGHEVVPLAADITDPAALENVLAEAAPDGIFHLAALAFVQSDDFAAFYRVNQIGTFNLLAAAAKRTPNAKIIIASSANIYGNRASGYLDEDCLPDPVNHYAMSKWMMELGVGLWMDKLDIIIVRPFNYTGVGQEKRYLIPKIIDHFKRREARIELGNLHVERDFGDVRSVVDAYARLITEGAPRQIYNICSGETHNIADILAVVSEMTGHRMEVFVNPLFVRSNEVSVLAGNPTRLMAAIPGWKSRPLKETIAWMLDP